MENSEKQRNLRGIKKAELTKFNKGFYDDNGERKEELLLILGFLRGQLSS